MDARVKPAHDVVVSITLLGEAESEPGGFTSDQSAAERHAVYRRYQRV
jgi:hypothetical protein